MNFEMHFIGYLYITDMINARKMERITCKTVYMWWTDRRVQYL